MPDSNNPKRELFDHLRQKHPAKTHSQGKDTEGQLYEIEFEYDGNQSKRKSRSVKRSTTCAADEHWHTVSKLVVGTNCLVN
jgi:hypothetical protein